MIKVGGASEVEVGELKDRIQDALCATRAASDEGIVPGGGSALLYASRKLETLKGENFDQDVGIKVDHAKKESKMVYDSHHGRRASRLASISVR